MRPQEWLLSVLIVILGVSRLRTAREWLEKAAGLQLLKKSGHGAGDGSSEAMSFYRLPCGKKGEKACAYRFWANGYSWGC